VVALWIGAAVALTLALPTIKEAQVGALGDLVPNEADAIEAEHAIFFLSRVRRRIADGEDARTAAVRGTAELLPIIVTAGLTVVGASASLVVAELGFFQAFGPGMAMAILIGLAVAITLIPALLAIGGRAVFWPRRPGVELSHGRRQRRRRRSARAGRAGRAPSRSPPAGRS
jgi:RND superfamily putative drug exporter